jgi:hypothetical protein
VKPRLCYVSCAMSVTVPSDSIVEIKVVRATAEGSAIAIAAGCWSIVFLLKCQKLTRDVTNQESKLSPSRLTQFRTKSPKCNAASSVLPVSGCGPTRKISMRAYVVRLLGMFCRDRRSLSAVSSLRQQWIALRSVLINSSYWIFATSRSQRPGVADYPVCIDGEETLENESA